MVSGWVCRKESDLSGPVCDWCRSLGYVVYCEIPIHGTCVDIVATRGDEIIAIELKTSLSRDVLSQAMRAQIFANQVWCGVPTRPRSLVIPQKRGIGIVRVVDGLVQVISHASENRKYLFGGSRREIMRVLATRQPGGVGGLPTSINDGPAQQVARLVAPLRVQGLRWKEIYDRVPNHYANWQSMQSVMNGYGPARVIIDKALGLVHG